MKKNKVRGNSNNIKKETSLLTMYKHCKALIQV